MRAGNITAGPQTLIVTMECPVLTLTIFILSVLALMIVVGMICEQINDLATPLCCSRKYGVSDTSLYQVSSNFGSSCSSLQSDPVQTFNRRDSIENQPLRSENPETEEDRTKRAEPAHHKTSANLLDLEDKTQDQPRVSWV